MLKKNKEFGYVYRKGSSVPKRDFTMIHAKSRYGGIRIGLSVSKKVGNAVVRNRVRRRMKEAMRQLLPMTHGHYAIVFVARSGIDEVKFDSLVQQMRSALRKAGILSEQGTGKT